MYNVLQGLRVPFLLLAGASFLWWHNWFLSTVFIVASVPLSWIAVVIANGHGQPRDPRTPQVYKPGLVREMNKRAALEAQKATELQEDDREGAGKMELYQDPLDFSGIVIDAEEPKEKRIDES